MTMHELLMIHIDKEYNRLSDCGNTLLSIKHMTDYTELQFQSTVMFTKLATEYEDITEKLNNVNFVVINCINNKELLRTCVDYINEISFMVMNFMLNIESLN